jgi:hypothetical protein
MQDSKNIAKEKKLYRKHAIILGCFAGAEVFRRNGMERLYWRGAYFPPGVVLKDDTGEAIPDILGAKYCYPDDMGYERIGTISAAVLSSPLKDVFSKVLSEALGNKNMIHESVMNAARYFLDLANSRAINRNKLSLMPNINEINLPASVVKEIEQKKVNLGEILEYDPAAGMLFSEIKSAIWIRHKVIIHQRDMDHAGFTYKTHLLPNGSAGYQVRFRDVQKEHAGE